MTRKMSFVFALALALALVMVGSGSAVFAQEDKPARPRNIILMIADGCGYGMLELTGHWKNGSAGSLLFESFPVHLSVITHSLDTGAYDGEALWSGFATLLADPTDSAAAVTATATGIKARNGVLSLDVNGAPVETVLERAEALGMASGIVTTSYFNDATPSGFAVHNVDRANRGEIAAYLIGASAVDFLSGCGHPWYNNDGRSRSAEPNWKYFGDEQLYSGLAGGSAGGDADGDGSADPWTFIDTRERMLKIIAGEETPKRVFALLRATNAAQALRSGHDDNADDDQPFETPRRADIPTFAEQARCALAVISRDPDGFFLMLENEGTDETGHMNRSGRTVEEVLEFEDGVRAVVEWVERNSSWEETLLIVTADHDTGLPNGPAGDGGLTPMTGRGKGKLPEHRWMTEDHANRPVPLFAWGAGAELLREFADQIDPKHGPVIDNTEIAAFLFRLLER